MTKGVLAWDLEVNDNKWEGKNGLFLADGLHYRFLFLCYFKIASQKGSTDYREDSTEFHVYQSAIAKELFWFDY